MFSLLTLVVSCKSNQLFEAKDDNNVTDVDGIVQLDESQNINQSVDLFLLLPNDDISDISWQQTSGNSVNLLASTSKAISFTPTQAGEYSFSVTFTLNGNNTQTLNKTVVINEDIHPLTARLSHTVLADNKVSYRTDLTSNIDINTLVWQQISGPSVTLTADNSNGDLAIFFDAPQVDSDTLITFNVSATDAVNNTTFQDQVAVLVEPASEIGSNAYFSDRVAHVFPYNSTSPYSENIVACVYSNTLTSSCILEKLPLLAEEVKGSTQPPTIENIMDRVVVSHRWMGDRFKDFLIKNDDNNDFKNLLRATTAIVIAYDVRPSFYWAATGAIYLDAENFWLTPDERDTINEAPDFRADFGNDLQFVMPWRYVKNNAYAYKSYNKTARVNRTENDTLYRLSALIYHELAHANDFIPSNEWYIHNDNRRVYDAALSSDFESDALAISLPLASQEMRDLGQVSFAGKAADETQKNYLPTDIEAFFSPDSASDYYAYSSFREDFAMLFEELMMQSRFGVNRDVAITNQPSGDNISSTDYIVTWGQRGRIGDDKLRERVVFSASRALPEFDSQSAINSVTSPIQMVKGNNWLDNLNISPSESSMITMRNMMRTINRGSTQDADIASTSVTEDAKNISVEHNSPYYHKALPNH